MENNNEKRMAGCWEILHALHIGDKEVVVGENLTAPNEARYMCAYCTANDIMRGYNECMASDDYLEIMELYTERITGQIEAVKAEIAERQLPDMTISADQCHKNDFSKKHCRQDCRHTRRCVKGASTEAQTISLCWSNGGFSAQRQTPVAARCMRPIYTAAKRAGMNAAMCLAR